MGATLIPLTVLARRRLGRGREIPGAGARFSRSGGCAGLMTAFNLCSLAIRRTPDLVLPWISSSTGSRRAVALWARVGRSGRHARPPHPADNDSRPLRSRFPIVRGRAGRVGTGRGSTSRRATATAARREVLPRHAGGSDAVSLYTAADRAAVDAISPPVIYARASRRGKRVTILFAPVAVAARGFSIGGQRLALLEFSRRSCLGFGVGSARRARPVRSCGCGRHDGR